MDVLGIRKALLPNRGEVGRDVENPGYDKGTLAHRLCEEPIPSPAAEYSQG